MASFPGRVSASVLIALLVLIPPILSAKDKRGAELIVSRKVGYSASGELIAVKLDSLLLLGPTGKDVSIAIDEIGAVSIVKKSKATKGFLTGLLIGGVAGGVAGAAVNAGSEYKGMNVVYGVLIFGTVGGFIGGLSGAAGGREEKIDFQGLAEPQLKKALDRLRGMARMSNAQ